MPLNPNIRKIMLQRELDGKKITQTELANKLGVTPQQFQLWLKGKSYPRAEKLYKLAELLEVSTDDLYEYKEDVNEGDEH